jgi:hypothetical protein
MPLEFSRDLPQCKISFKKRLWLEMFKEKSVSWLYLCHPGVPKIHRFSATLSKRLYSILFQPGSAVQC